MGRAVRSNSNRLGIWLVLAALAGCARTAPDLPPTFAAPARQADTQEQQTRCPLLASHIAELRQQMATINEVIAGRRHEDQVEGYLAAVLFPPAALAIDQQRVQKKALDDRQREIDADLGEQHALRCS